MQNEGILVLFELSLISQTYWVNVLYIKIRFIALKHFKMRIKTFLTILKIIVILKLVLVISVNDHKAELHMKHVYKFEDHLNLPYYNVSELRYHISMKYFNTCFIKGKRLRKITINFTFLLRKSMKNIFIMFVTLLSGDVELNPEPLIKIQQKINNKCPYFTIM